jgi:hypothetical protein
MSLVVWKQSSARGDLHFNAFLRPSLDEADKVKTDRILDHRVDVKMAELAWWKNHL